MKTKQVWIKMKEVKPPKDWTLPFRIKYQGKEYKITGVDYVDEEWRAEEWNTKNIEST